MQEDRTITILVTLKQITQLDVFQVEDVIKDELIADIEDSFRSTACLFTTSEPIIISVNGCEYEIKSIE